MEHTTTEQGHELTIESADEGGSNKVVFSYEPGSVGITCFWLDYSPRRGLEWIKLSDISVSVEQWAIASEWLARKKG